MKVLNNIIAEKSLPFKNNVNVIKNINHNVNVEELTLPEILNLLQSKWDSVSDKEMGVAKTIIDIIGDSEANIKFHIKMVKKVQPERLIECAMIAKDAKRNNFVRNSVPKYYVGILKKKGLLK